MESLDRDVSCEYLEHDSVAEKLNQAMDDERVKMRYAISTLSKIATLTVADTYETENMGVVFSPDRQDVVNAERSRLNQSLGEMAKKWGELNTPTSEVQGAVGSLQYTIDPESN